MGCLALFKGEAYLGFGHIGSIIIIQRGFMPNVYRALYEDEIALHQILYNLFTI